MICFNLKQSTDVRLSSSPVPRTLLDSSPSGFPTVAMGNSPSNHLVKVPRTSLEGNVELVKVSKI